MPSLNDYIRAERANRYKAAAVKKSETARVRAAALEQRAPRFDRPVTVRTTFYEPDMRRDADNVGFARKFVLDGLVAAGVIKDDSRRAAPQVVAQGGPGPHSRAGGHRPGQRDTERDAAVEEPAR